MLAKIAWANNASVMRRYQPVHSLQQITRLPPSPPTVRPLGPVYRLLASNPAPSLAGVGINMAFSADELSTGGDGWVELYCYPRGGTRWHATRPSQGQLARLR